ncbi:Ig-like domain-containing protein [Alloalcanivorax xenomutans]|uniref:Ig-like domain-containing protein n=1 Tax=Alloalcanivorax xenomutans TaxID=1094342 RepID=UPI000BCA5742|nr:Ig-like domain-containing protein [Alloalcanivorax xenomutans]SOC25103.1 Ig-like domain-containing protein [Alloalcanivorax xenomutans]
MITLTLKRGALLISSALILSACGGGGGSDMPGPDAGESKRQSLLYAYPDNGQTEVPTPAPVVLRFSSAVTVDAAEAAITLHEGDASGPTLAATFSTVDGEPRGLVLTPDDKLKPLTDYTVVIKNLKLEKGTAANQVLGFTTRPMHEGPRSLVVSSDDFVIERRIPDGGSSEPVMDFSTFRFQFSQPIDPATVHYGNAPASSTAPADNVGLYDSQGNLVDAVLVVNDRYMTVDPNPQSDDPEDKYFSYLTPGETYTLRLGDGITSVYGETFGGDEIAFTPKDSSPRGEPAVLVQRITDSANRTNLSPLTGKPINEVPVNGVLLGEDANITQASNNAVMAELADVTQYPDVTPIRLPRNTVLDGSSIDVLIGGHVPAGFSSGQVEMRMLSDATGYLVPNPYNSNRSDALRIVHLFMDVAIATEDPRTNGAFTQDILHIELIGTAAVDTTEGVLNIDAVSVVEPNVLGQEYGYGLLSFQLQSYKDQQNPPVDAVAEMEDNQPPVLQSWTLGEYTDENGVVHDKSQLYMPGDPIILNFSEKLDLQNIGGERFVFYENGIEQEISYYADGTSIVIKPKNNLKNPRPEQDYVYSLTIPTGITDLAGNPLQPSQINDITLPLVVTEREAISGENGAPPPTTGPIPVEHRSPIVLSTYPGFPCAIDETTRDLDNDIQGRCEGAFPGWDQGSQYDQKEADDLLPVPKLSANKPIVVQFSREIDPMSIKLGSSFLVSEFDENGNSTPVEGAYSLSGKVLKFTPATPWVEGKLYSYTLKSNGDSYSNTATCDGSQAICDLDGYPIQTDYFADIDFEPVYAAGPPGTPLPDSSEREWNFLTERKPYDAGGPDIVLYFKGDTTNSNVLQILANSPSYDVNANFVHEKNEQITDGSGAFYTSPATDLYQYYAEEKGADDQPLDPNADPLLDPNGVLPPPNSAKVFSLDTRGVEPDSTKVPPAPVVNGASVGCGYKEAIAWDPAVPFAVYGIPYECPKQKFTYLTGALTAEVTGEYVEGRGIKVLIWPSQFMSTSIPVRFHLTGGPIFGSSKSGAQMLRMRYSKGQSGVRSQPIEGWIKDEGNGTPILTTSVDLYMDGIELGHNLPYLDPTHSFMSYPATMDLSGEIQFLDDGRMMISQFNTNDVDIDIVMHQHDGVSAGSLPLRIPAYGSRLQYISAPIK